MTEAHEFTTKAPTSVDRDRLQAVIEPVVRAHGAELVDVELKNETGWVLRVYVEKLGASTERMSTKQAAVDLELCSEISRELSPVLDVADLIPQRYHLEVGSPGIERSLKKTADYERFQGEKAKLKLRAGLQGQKVLVGALGAVADGKVALVDGARSYEVPLDDVVSARLVFEFGPASRRLSPSSGGKTPGGKQKKKKG